MCKKEHGRKGRGEQTKTTPPPSPSPQKKSIHLIPYFPSSIGSRISPTLPKNLLLYLFQLSVCLHTLVFVRRVVHQVKEVTLKWRDKEVASGEMKEVTPKWKNKKKCVEVEHKRNLIGYSSHAFRHQRVASGPKWTFVK